MKESVMIHLLPVERKGHTVQPPSTRAGPPLMRETGHGGESLGGLHDVHGMRSSEVQ